MLDILSLVIPFFAVIACGYFGASLIGEAGQEGINNLVLYFALPVLIFSLMARSNLAERFQSDFVMAYVTVSVLLFCLAFMVLKSWFRLRRGDAAVYAMGTIYGNTGYMGVPVIVIAMGNQASVPVVISLIIDVGVMIPIAAAIIESGKDGQSNSLLHGAATTLLATFRNPLIIAAILGVAWSLLSIPMPIMLNGFLDLLGTAAAPCALFALGASLYGKPMDGAIAPSLVVSVVKLVVHPILLLIGMTFVFDIPKDWAHPAVIAAGMPVAATVYVVARQYQTLVIGASSAIMISTGLSLVSLPVLMFLLAG